jgi:hypothetical protein
MKYMLTYGLISGAIVAAVLVTALAFGSPDGHLYSQLFGYLAMLVALTFVFVGVKRFRDVECGGAIRFWPALKVGLGIAGVAALVYVLSWEAYLAASGRDFMADYIAAIARERQADGVAADAIAREVAEMQEMAVNYRNPLFRMPITFLEIFPVGLAVALVSAALLRNPRLLPPRVRAAA